MRVKDVMSTAVITVSDTATVAEAIALMIGARISGLPVIGADGTLVGILSEGDLLRRVEFGTEKRRPRWLEWLVSPGRQAFDYTHANGRIVGEVMTIDPATIEDTATFDELVALMQRRSIKRLPVMRDGKLVGIVTRADIVRGLAGFLAPPYEEQATSDAEIRRRIVTEFAAQSWAPQSSVEVSVKDGVVRLEGWIFDERERAALKVGAENVPGVRSVEDQLRWIEPSTGTTIV